jgi:hypothetical protein
MPRIRTAFGAAAAFSATSKMLFSLAAAAADMAAHQVCFTSVNALFQMRAQMLLIMSATPHLHLAIQS